MKRKNAKGTLTLAGIVTAAALSLTSKPNYDIPKDTYYDKMGGPAFINTNNQISFLPHYSAILDNTADTLDVRRDDYRTLDSLINKAKIITPSLQIPLIYNGEKLDSLENSMLNSLVSAAVNRPMINEEALVNSILNTINDYDKVISKDFVKASIKEESWYDPKIISRSKARGLMQFKKSAWEHFGEGSYLPNVYDPEKNIRAGIKYYKWMEEEFSKKHPRWDALTVEEKQGFLAAGYNGGPYRLMDKKFKVNWNIKKMPQESIDHIAKINTTMEQFHLEGLYRDIAMYRVKIERHESERNKVFWLAYSAANTGAFMNNYIYKTKSSS